MIGLDLICIRFHSIIVVVVVVSARGVIRNHSIHRRAVAEKGVMVKDI